MTARLEASYVLPLKWQETSRSAELALYLDALADLLEVIVVDGSPSHVYEHHATLWGKRVRHVPPDPSLTFLNGKVNGVTTGVRVATYERVVVADDDIRYQVDDLREAVAHLDAAELVLVQSYFDPAPWHAQWDTARTLLNRVFGVHFPVSVGLRRSLFMALDGYDGDVLFENLELMRTLSFAGARSAQPRRLFVRHLPPERGWFWSQRVRQAYDDFTLPLRMGVWLSVVPAVFFCVAMRRSRAIPLGAFALTALAEAGRRRDGAQQHFPPTASLFASLWVLERGVCAWIAVWQRLVRGGVSYHGRRLRRSATPPPRLRRRVAQKLERHRRVL